MEFFCSSKSQSFVRINGLTVSADKANVCNLNLRLVLGPLGLHENLRL
jgi:hypothetical protein